MMACDVSPVAMFVCDILSWKWCYVLNQILIGLSFQTPLQFLENGLFPEVRGEKSKLNSFQMIIFKTITLTAFNKDYISFCSLFSNAQTLVSC